MKFRHWHTYVYRDANGPEVGIPVWGSPSSLTLCSSVVLQNYYRPPALAHRPARHAMLRIYASTRHRSRARLIALASHISAACSCSATTRVRTMQHCTGTVLVVLVAIFSRSQSSLLVTAITAQVLSIRIYNVPVPLLESVCYRAPVWDAAVLTTCSPTVFLSLAMQL